jgi:hypothetical protein
MLLLIHFLIGALFVYLYIKYQIIPINKLYKELGIAKKYDILFFIIVCIWLLISGFFAPIFYMLWRLN